MSQFDDCHMLPAPLFDVLLAIGSEEHGNAQHFDMGTLFWSVTRLFGCYERVMHAAQLPHNKRPFLDADIENFIIRFRIVLNDIAYITWQLLPKNTRGLKGPRGGTHPKNKEMSISTLASYLEKQNATYPELAAAFSKTSSWMTRLKNDRDNIVHYKSRVVIFGGDAPSFAFLNAARTERTLPTPEGGEMLALEPVTDFVNNQMHSLHFFMHTDLSSAIEKHAARLNIKESLIKS